MRKEYEDSLEKWWKWKRETRKGRWQRGSVAARVRRRGNRRTNHRRKKGAGNLKVPSARWSRRSLFLRSPPTPPMPLVFFVFLPLVLTHLFHRRWFSPFVLFSYAFSGCPHFVFFRFWLPYLTFPISAFYWAKLWAQPRFHRIGFKTI